VSDADIARPRARRTGRILQWLALVASGLFIVWVLGSRAEDLRRALALTPLLFALISASALVTFLLNGAELRLLVRRFDCDLLFHEAIALGLMTSTLNYLPLKTGTLLNAAYLRTRRRVPFAHFAALTAASGIVHLWAAALLAGIALLVRQTLPLLGALLVVVPGAAVAALYMWGRSARRGRFDEHDSRLVRLAGRAVDGLGLLFASPRLIALEIAINLALVGLGAARMLWSLEALSVDRGFGAAVVVIVFAIVAERLAIIPGGLGIKESGAALGSNLVGVSPSMGFAASLIDRGVMLVWLIALGIPSALWLQHRAGVSLAEARSIAATEGVGDDG
jgi:uncharacterized membrane protein YbhN (UPF0104 family)